VHATGWSHGLEVSGGGTGVVSHARLVLSSMLSVLSLALADMSRL
jgi:hypothetical protein